MTAPLSNKQVEKDNTAAVHMNETFLLTIKVYYSPTNAQVIVLKTILKFKLK
jgi:hypothetical protein